MSRYKSNTPCKRGHVGDRYIRTGNCCECERIRSKERCTTPRWRAYQRAYLKKRYYSDPAYREKKRSIRRRVYHRDGKGLERVIRRYAAKKMATPSWLTKEHIVAMQTIYTVARMLTKESGVKMDVDHIIPLNGKNVCGLHVPWNLQVTPAYINRSKANKVLPTWKCEAA